MKLKPRFFDGTAFKKDLTRFAPLWALYLIGGLMVAQSVMNQYYRDADYAFYYNARQLSGFIGYFGAINLVYAMLCAQLLQGDLFNSKLCNALHAMPLRRENWFVTHTVSGLLFSLVPNLVMALSILPYLEGLWFTAFLWLLGMELHFLFFFGLATFTVHCTGNRFASVVVYIILNFLSVLALWFVDTIYGPLLYGVELNLDTFLMLCPVVWLFNEPDYFQVTVADAPPGDTINLPQVGPSTYWEGLGDSWSYLTVLAVVGLVLLVLALVLYRKRNLESAGDFVAFKPMKPIFWVVFTLGAGGAMQFIGENMLDVGESGSYVFLALGLVCGYFVARMLIARTVKVFGGRNWLQLAVFLGVFLLSIGLTLLDPLGVTRYMPDENRVEAVYVGNSNTRYITDRDRLTAYGNFYSEDPADVAAVQQVHQLLIDEGKVSENVSRDRVYVVYFLKNGGKVVRFYRPSYTGKANRAVWELQGKYDQIIPYDSFEEFKADIGGAAMGGELITYPVLDGLLQALWADAQEGNLLQDDAYHRYAHTNGNNHESVKTVVTLYWKKSITNKRNLQFEIYACCKNTTQWLADYEPGKEFLNGDVEELARHTKTILFRDRVFESDFEKQEILSCLQQDLSYGCAYRVLQDMDADFVVQVDLDGQVYAFCLDSEKSITYAFLKKLMNQ